MGECGCQPQVSLRPDRPSSETVKAELRRDSLESHVEINPHAQYTTAFSVKCQYGIRQQVDLARTIRCEQVGSKRLERILN
jgi:hypothetical protein